MRKNMLFEDRLPELSFNVAQLLKGATGARRVYQVHTNLTGQVDEDLALVGPLNGAIEVMRTGPKVLVTGELTAVVQKACVRCLEPFTAPISLEIEETFQPTVDVLTGRPLELDEEEDELDPATLIDEQHQLDLTEVVRQDLLLASEAIRYCQPDCRGLCPVCGQNLNEGECGCQADFIDERWAGLLEIELEDNPSEA